jgi:hypothetical protein
VDGDHPDSVNPADGVIAFTGMDRANFTSKGGLIVQLVRWAQRDTCRCARERSGRR